jgi:EPS-associated MarR family transcriptional regulator
MINNLFQILKVLEKDSNFTQRKLSNILGVSLGKINYCMKKLIDKGFIKANNFKNHKNKTQYSYLLTPKGIEEKARLTIEFIKIKTKEYDELKKEIDLLKEEANKLNGFHH